MIVRYHRFFFNIVIEPAPCADKGQVIRGRGKSTESLRSACFSDKQKAGLRMEQQLILKNRAFIQDRASKLVLVGSLVLVFVVMPLAILSILDKPLDTETLFKLMDALQLRIINAFHEEPIESSFVALIYLSFPVYLLYIYLANRNERLILTPIGIRYVSAFPEPFDFLHPGWFVRWDQVTNARLDPTRFGLGPILSALTLTTRTHKRRLRPYVWVNPDTWRRVIKRRFGIPVQPDKAELLENVINADLVEYVQSHIPGMEMNIGTGAAGKQPFHLDSNLWSGGMSVALLVLLGYALVDTFILKTEVFVGEPPVEIYAAGGLLAAAVAALLLVRARLPLYVCILLPSMLGLAFAAALHPALLRINQLTDTSGLATYSYIRQADGRYLPKDVGPPPVSRDYPPEYWSQFSSGSTHEFELRKGGLGFWQLSEVPLKEAYYDYFETLRNKREDQ